MADFVTMNEESIPLLVAIVGATATGKSDLAVALAQEVDGEIINADAMQLYRGMDIGTAKLPASERAGIAHHLLDVLSVREEASVAAYQAAALEIIKVVQQRGRIPILVGGSGLYVHAVIDRLEIPPTDPEVRARWEQHLAERGAPALHAELVELDPVAAQSILPTNGRRIVRALEVITLTGAPFSASLPERTYRIPTLQLGLKVPRPVLDERIESRVCRMWTDGLVAETEGLVRQGLREGRTAWRALGYRQVLQLLDGELDEAATQSAIITATRRFARRQESWFGRDDRVIWRDPGQESQGALVNLAMARMRRLRAAGDEKVMP